ncbi:MAG TPA: hypothetical protein VGK89_10755 [Candidatus Eisenbacteria bacterium]|jgi:hypothetical protein
MPSLFATLLPRILGGARIHRAALEALHRGRAERAVALFERAAHCYRRELAVEPLARVRVQQLIARARVRPEGSQDSLLALEIEGRLCRLDRIEALEPPFPLVEARELLAGWMKGGAGEGARARRAA